MTKTAVVVFNLGGPDNPAAVRPFLKNLFSDPMILRVPRLLRAVLAFVIAWRRAPVAREIYENLGGRSPILPETEKQATALERALAGGRSAYRVFVSMRYWHPFAEETARDVASWKPDRIILLPLYPQFSTTTTESFLRVWKPAARKAGLDVPSSTICCWPDLDGFVGTVARLVTDAIGTLPPDTPFRVLFSAHGLPKKIVDEGDPYADQVQQTAAEILARLQIADLDHVVCYQSRVGPLEWLKPYTEDEIHRAGQEGKSLVVVPIAFVSEHSETLVELDIEYAELAEEAGVPRYVRVPTVSDDPVFIQGLAELVETSQADDAPAGEKPSGSGPSDRHGSSNNA